MLAAEQAIMDRGSSVEELMEIAAGGAAEWIRRIAAGRSVTVLCGPGNNGGDGYVIARKMREFGNSVRVVAPVPPKTEAAVKACEAWSGKPATSGGDVIGEVLVDCLFGSGLSRPLTAEHVLLLRDLAGRHACRIAIDVPSGVDSDTGAQLNDQLPHYDVTLALGAWKFAHWCLPARAATGTKRLVPIGASSVDGAARLVERPSLETPAENAHKYTRGLCAVVGGDMPGAALLASQAAMRAGAGYVKLIRHECADAPAGLVVDPSPLKVAGEDHRIRSMLIGPGLARHEGAGKALETALSQGHNLVLDADALVLLQPYMLSKGTQILATPHDGELEHLCKSFSVITEGRMARAKAVAAVSDMVICAKGPDTIIAAPDGRIALAAPAPSWLSVAGTGDVLAGIAASRMATGSDAFGAACEAVWLHGEAARQCGAMFTAEGLANRVGSAYRACL
ncbi:NAD(P)H-hydrate dehydratase [Erythrobacter sp. WH158]|uniref:ADP-dependent (S)-NAD(P)H-hydrate dehydratase n=2 Tax=Erythrobacter crassostreae TaxID=2828328 RepID=A0A9X1JLD7_9SPHN|nr:NAD(P)H-hydrate dehydratase [Erythrobacter crassostrea]MBV7260035.1 NAD(P)H-hydrate dehydratase [Erythrobacter crassostrea]